MQVYWFLVFTVLAYTLNSACDGAKILAFLPLAARSHFIAFAPLIDELVKRGHDVTLYGPFKTKSKNLKFVEINTEVKMQKMLDSVDFSDMSFGQSIFVPLISFWKLALLLADDYYTMPQVQNLIHSNELKFDLIITEALFGQEPVVAFGHKFKAPVISLSSFGSFMWLDEFAGNPHPLSIVPFIETDHTDKMTFLQRAYNCFEAISKQLGGYLIYFPIQERTLKTHFNYSGSADLPPLRNMLNNISLFLLNTHESVSYPRPYTPNVVQAAGFHIETTRKPLPKDVQHFMDEAKDGVIYFSLGSVVPVEKMPESWVKSFVECFRMLPQRVLWKLNVETLPELPSNIKVGKWFPQQDVLAHPKCVVFITHGGLLSMQEATYFGVPLIGIPIFGDQPMNVAKMVDSGMGVKLDYKTVTLQAVSAALQTVLHHPEYRENAKHQSRIFRDTPMSGLDKAAFWIEYILRHNGAPHLRSAATELNFFQYHLLDVIALFLFFLTVTVALIYFALSAVYRRIFTRPPKNNSKNKNKKQQ